MWPYETDSLERWIERLSKYLIVEVVFNEKERGRSVVSGVKDNNDKRSLQVMFRKTSKLYQRPS